MGDLWSDEGFGGTGFGTEEFGGGDDWDEGEESLETELEDGFADPEELEGAFWNGEDEDE
jgi:hypothetical protein